MLYEKLNTQQKMKKVFIFGDISFDLSSLKLFSPITDYIQIIESNAFFNSITKPTCVTPSLQTTTDYNLTNDSESILTPGVLTM